LESRFFKGRSQSQSPKFSNSRVGVGVPQKNKDSASMVGRNSDVDLHRVATPARDLRSSKDDDWVSVTDCDNVDRTRCSNSFTELNSMSTVT